MRSPKLIEKFGDKIASVMSLSTSNVIWKNSKSVSDETNEAPGERVLHGRLKTLTTWAFRSL